MTDRPTDQPTGWPVDTPGHREVTLPISPHVDFLSEMESLRGLLELK